MMILCLFWGYDVEEKAGRAYDQAALKYWGSSSHINFTMKNYKEKNLKIQINDKVCLNCFNFGNLTTTCHHFNSFLFFIFLSLFY